MLRHVRGHVPQDLAHLEAAPLTVIAENALVLLLHRLIGGDQSALGAYPGAGRHAPGWLHRLLTRLDPTAAARIHPNDQPKLIRAIEVCLSARQPITEAWQAGRDPLTGYRLLRIGLNPPRAALYDRINQRARSMFDQGLVEETQSILTRYGASIPILDALGYRQAHQLLQGQLTCEEAIAAAQQGHRNYAKRQLTWFRREPDVLWLAGFGNQPDIFSATQRLITEALATPASSEIPSHREKIEP